jgi:hypothetical protein
MKKAIVCLLALLLLIGCAPVDEESEAQQPAQEQKETKTTQTPKAPVVEEETPELSSEFVALIEEEMKPAIRASHVYPHSIKLKYGDIQAFGVAVQNTLKDPEEFQIKVVFDKAYDKYTNQIDVDEAVMNSWLKTNLEIFELVPGEETTLTIIMEVGNKMSGVKPTPGTYVFDVEILHRAGRTDMVEDYVAPKELAIRIDK